ncbi:hypothetical protein EON64_17455 [archaeon]|nr:MAG: hypothetical protein EON64_17455 [archaeon]
MLGQTLKAGPPSAPSTPSLGGRKVMESLKSPPPAGMKSFASGSIDEEDNDAEKKTLMKVMGFMKK